MYYEVLSAEVATLEARVAVLEAAMTAAGVPIPGGASATAAAAPAAAGGKGKDAKDAKAGADGKPLTKSALKALKKQEEIAKKKAAKAAEKAAKDEENRKRFEANLAEAAKVKISLDPALPAATTVRVHQCGQHVGKRVVVQGWVHRLRSDKEKKFIVLRDGYEFSYVQVIMTGDLIKTRDALLLSREAAIRVWGTLVEDARAAGGKEPSGPYELHADYWEVVGASPSEIEGVVTHKSDVDLKMNMRHIVSRGTNTSAVLKGRSKIVAAFREHLFSKGLTEVTPPSIVQTQVEGGSTLFKLDYFGEPAYLTQSSQLYLETAIPWSGACFCLQSSFRAEKSQTLRHLSEFIHLEAEYSFCTFDDLLEHIEDMVVSVMTRVQETAGDILKHLNPDFKVPEKPFMRMEYKDAIEYCNKHGILNPETGEAFKPGEDISEKPEREMTDKIGRPIFMTRFPVSMKPFYMSRPADDNTVTESVDLLYPGVGEIVGGSMREPSLDTLLEQIKHEGLDAEAYYWYVDQRRYGTQPHGGFGLGIERFVMCLLGQKHIRDVCLFPRMMGRCKP